MSQVNFEPSMLVQYHIDQDFDRKHYTSIACEKGAYHSESGCNHTQKNHNQCNHCLSFNDKKY